MKKCLSAILLLAMSIGLGAADYKVVFRKMAEAVKGNERFPIVAENVFGERIYAYRGSDAYAHYLYYKNGKWTGGGRVPGSPQFDDYWFSDIVADSTGRFHYVCEEADHAMFYAHFQKGQWTPMRLIDTRHEATLALAVRSNDTVVLVAPFITRNPKGVTKDVLVGTKREDANNFTGFKNVTNDFGSSTMVDAAIDAQDNTWISYKGTVIKGTGESLQAMLLGLDKNNNRIYFKNVSGMDDPAWCWYPRIAINSDGLIMVTWIMSQQRMYFYRLYDPAKDKWTEVKALAPGTTSPWPFMYNKLLARGTDFFWIGLNPGRTLSLHKYDAKKNDWDKVADVSQGGVNWFSACNSRDSILVSYESMTSPASCFLATVTVAPLGPPPSRISGKVTEDSAGVSGVVLTGFPVDTVTDSSGSYSATVKSGWTGKVTPVKEGRAFAPASREYVDVTADKTGQDYAAFPPVNSVANLRAVKRIERGFFHGYTLYALTWEANPENNEHNIAISAQRVYRKARTENNSKWVRIIELSGTALKYEDLNVRADSDYVYAVTCVNDKGFESPIY